LITVGNNTKTEANSGSFPCTQCTSIREMCLIWRFCPAENTISYVLSTRAIGSNCSYPARLESFQVLTRKLLILPSTRQNASKLGASTHHTPLCKGIRVAQGRRSAGTAAFRARHRLSTDWCRTGWPKHLARRCGNKIVLWGHSGGSVLGAWMVTRKPDLLWAFVGTGQVGNPAGAHDVAFAALPAKAGA
jgi:hypothetical protein